MREYETHFLVEFVRHGARAHYEDNVPASFFGGVGKGELTEKGKDESYRIGLDRKKEYIQGKRFLKQRNMKEEVISISTFKNRCLDSGS